MTVKEALHQAILEDPDNDTLRLAYARWLEEDDLEDEAAFIRNMLKMANPQGANHETLKQCEQQVTQFLDSEPYHFYGYSIHHYHLNEIWHPFVRFWRRGFLHRVHVGNFYKDTPNPLSDEYVLRDVADDQPLVEEAVIAYDEDDRGKSNIFTLLEWTVRAWPRIRYVCLHGKRYAREISQDSLLFKLLDNLLAFTCLEVVECCRETRNRLRWAMDRRNLRRRSFEVLPDTGDPKFSGATNRIRCPRAALSGEVAALLKKYLPRPSTTTTLTASSATSIVGQPLTFTATVTSSADNPVRRNNPTGLVTIQDGDKSLASPSLNDNAQAIQVLSNLAAGTYHLTAAYNGSDDFSPSTSEVPISVTVYTEPVSPATFQSVRSRIDALLTERGFESTGAYPTVTWARNPLIDQGFWAEWGGPRWVLTAELRKGELWFGVEKVLLLHALQAASGHSHGHHPPPDLNSALSQLGGTVQGLEDWWRWRDELFFRGHFFLAGQDEVTLAEQKLEALVNDLVDGLVTFVNKGRPWLSQGTGDGFGPDLCGTEIPPPATNPFHPFLRLSRWLANNLSERGYTVRGPEAVVQWLAQPPASLRYFPDPSMSASLSWHPPISSGWPQEDRVVKLVHRREGVYWFGVRTGKGEGERENYAAYCRVPMNLFDQNHIVNRVWFSGFWVRDTEQSRQRVRSVLRYLSPE